jgi:hypothetical protein
LSPFRDLFSVEMTIFDDFLGFGFLFEEECRSK